MAAARPSDQASEQKVKSGEATQDESQENSEMASADKDSSASDSRVERIRQAAYAAAERRGFEPGFETDDWLAAEREIDSAESRDSDTSKPG